MPRWTDDQQAAIDARKCNLLVSAAAGSGKTAVLVERIIKLVIEEQVPIDEMLIVTFTNAAASEMRERIIEALYEALAKDQNEFLRNQINNIQKANIMTLHAFCIQVARNNAHFIDLDPGFKVGDQVELSLLRAEVLDRVLEDAYEENSSGFVTFIESFSENRQDQKIVNLILDTYNFIQSQPEPLEWLLKAVDNMDNSQEYLNLLKKNISFDLSSSQELIEQAILLAEMPDGPTEYLEALESDLNLIESLDVDVSTLAEKIQNISYSKLKRIAKGRKEEVDEKLLDEVKDLRKSFKDLMNGIKSIFEYKTVEDYMEDIHLAQPNMYQLYKLVQAFHYAYQADKQDKSLVDFNDLEHFALAALKEESVRKYYQDKFEYIFLDEYQDSNLVQETIIASIKREDNLFLVGDVKQSIYKFRLADPSLFMEKYNTFSKLKGQLNRRIDLKKNFRSRHEILIGINYLFENLMSENFGEITYDDDAKLYTGINFGQIDDPSIHVHVLEGKYTGDDALKELTTAEVEAMLIAQKIKSMIGKASYDRKQDKYFNLDYKHIVVLLRAVSSWAPVFNDVFMQEGIPLYADGTSGYFDTIEIRIMIDLLKLIDNPYQDIPLLTVLRSPLFDFTTEDLVDIRNCTKEGYYYEALLNYQGRLNHKVQNLFDKLKLWQDKSRYETLGNLIWDIMHETGFYQYVLAMPGGKNRQGNLRLLVDRADQMQYASLFNFIQMIERMKKTNTELGTAKIIGENENVVRIMSIHKSKGLEFPIVFVAGLGKRFNMQDTFADVLFHKRLGLGPKFIDPIHRVYFDTLPKKLIKRQIKFESLAEEMRILYVALTRAVDRLILVGTYKNLENGCKKWYRGNGLFQLTKAQSYLDWIMSILSSHPDGQIISDSIDKTFLGKAEASRWKIFFDNRLAFNQESSSEETLLAVLNNIEDYQDLSFNKKLGESLKYVYPMKVDLPSKISVSALKSLETDQLLYHIDNLEVPTFVEEKAKTGAEIGTLVHYVMQKLSPFEAVEKQIARLVEEGMLLTEDLKHLNIEQYKNFFESEIGLRLQKSKKVEREKSFVLKKKIKDLMSSDSKDSIYIQGIIDCYFEEEDGLVLIDYKTDHIRDLEQFKKLYSRQLDLYKEALMSITKKAVKETYIYSFFNEMTIKI